MCADHAASVTAPVPGVIASSIAGCRYFAMVLRSIPKLSASWRRDRPACQWMNNSIRSNMSKFLLAIGALPHGDP